MSWRLAESLSSPQIEALIFDLDGVLVATEVFHREAWARLAMEEGLYFDDQLYDLKMRGVSRLQCLDHLLDHARNKGRRSYDPHERAALADRKNGYYREFIQSLTPDDALSGSRELLSELRRAGIKTAIGSSSRNAKTILERTALTDYFDAIVDGTDVCRTKPDPDVFLLAAERLNLPPYRCVVLEDAPLGVEAGHRAGMQVIAIGPAVRDQGDCWVADVASLSIDLFQRDSESSVQRAAGFSPRGLATLESACQA